MPKAFTEQERKILAERLLEEGFKQFSAYGLKKTSVDELVAAVGMSKGAFYLFYDSKEALFMDVVEAAEGNFRKEVLAVVDQPGESARARLFAVLKQAFSLWKTIPMLTAFTRTDYDLLFRKMPAEKLQEHLESDRKFTEELIARCQAAGIPIRISVDELNGLIMALFFNSLHEEDFAPYNFPGTMDILLELVAAYCLGEVDAGTLT